MTATEYVVLVNSQNQETGLAEKMAAHRQNLLHRAFSVFIFRDNQGLELLLQQRALSKYHSPGRWTNTCCSHPRQGEAILAAGARRLQEEMGLSDVVLDDLGWFHYNAHFENGLSENEIDHVLIGIVGENHPFTPNPEEVASTRWISRRDLEAELATHPDQFTPWLQAGALEMLRKHFPKY